MKDTKALLEKMYPLVEQKILKNKNKLHDCVGRFISARHDQLNAIAPYYRIYFGEEDENDFFNSMDLDKKQLEDIIKQTYYYSIAKFNPRYAKSPFVCAVLCVIRYWVLKNDKTNTELYTGYLAFSGHYYPSVHYRSFPKVQPSEYPFIMDYVVNNELSGRYDLKQQGNVFKAVRSIGMTWIDSYKGRFRSFDDEDCVYLIQQLRTRLASFMANIAKVYYDVYNRKDSLFTFDGDSLDENNYHLADSNSLYTERIVENTVTYITSNRANYEWCQLAQDKQGLVKADEIKEIIESIVEEPENVPDMRILIRNIVSTYMSQSKSKDMKSYEFLKYSVTPKPNSKDKLELEKNAIVEKWLCENSPLYRKRRNRPATQSAYKKAIISYVSLCIYIVNKNTK